MDYPTGWVQEPKIAKVTPSQIAALPPERQTEIQEVMREWEQTLKDNPLYGIYARNPNQHAFLEAPSKINALFGGNRSGKTAAMSIKAIINCVPPEWVPPHLMQYRLYGDSTDPFYCRLVVPSQTQHAIGVVLPLLQRWIPKATLRTKGWDKAWNSKFMILHFDNGSFIEFRSYDQDLSAHQGTSRHLIGFDEQPPKNIYEESMLRLAEYEGSRCMFALTPLGLSWIYHDIYKKRNDENANISVFNSSIHDNDTLDKESVRQALESVTNSAQREAREYGRFVSMAGRIYDNFEGKPVEKGGHIYKPLGPSDITGDVYVGIDPGIRSPAAIFCLANDLTEQVVVFDEVTPYSESTMDIERFVNMILQRVQDWGIRDPIYIIDPAARGADQRTGEALLTEYARHGIAAIPGNNDLQVGIERVYNLISRNQFGVTSNCTTFIDEIEIWSWDQRMEDSMGRARPQEGNDHTLDALRYVVMMLPWVGAPVKRNPPPRPGTLEHEIKMRQPPVQDLEVLAWQ